jgi:iron complex transport system ATP-binding protein
MSLQAKGVSFSYGKHTVLDKISFNFEQGDFVAILGPNGAGKTTMLRLLNKILKPAEGSIKIEDKNIASLNRKEIAQIIGYVPQRGVSSPITVYEMILLGRIPYLNWSPSYEDHRICSEIIDILGLGNLILKKVDEISGGEFQLVQIGRSLAQKPKVLLLDEPTSNLDLQNQLKIMKSLKQITKESKVLTLVAIHDLNLALRHANKFLLLKDGSIFASGDSEIITSASIKEVYNIDADVVTINNYQVVVPN